MSDFVTRVRELGGLFWRGAREKGEAAAEAFDQRTQIQRLALQIRKLDRERTGLIRQIGAKVYGLHGQGKVRNQDVLTDCKRIDEIITGIFDLRKEIEKIRAASLEKGIEVPILSDEAPLDEEEAPATAASAAAASAAVKPAGTTGEQDLPAGGVTRASEGRVEFDEEGTPLDCVSGPSEAAVPVEDCEVELEAPADPAAAPAEEK